MHRYTHECSNCTFKGSWGKYDVWLCLNDGMSNLDTFIVRYGPGGDYVSWTRGSLSEILSGIVTFQRTEKGKLNDTVWAVLEVIFKDHSSCRKARESKGKPLCKGDHHGHV